MHQPVEAPELPLEMALQRRIMVDEIEAAQDIEALRNCAIQVLDLWLQTRAMAARLGKQL